HNDGMLLVGFFDSLVLSGTIANAGTIKVDTWAGHLYTVGDVSLDGGGHLALTGGSVVFGPNSPTTLHNVDNTVSGVGTIGGQGLAFDNQSGGLVDAQDITLSAPVTNASLIEAADDPHAVLHINNTTVTQSGSATIAAYGDGTHVDLNNSIIRGG